MLETSAAVIHYVTRGVNAPPLNDDDGDRVPDFVERTADAALKAQSYFRTAGYLSIRADTGGPNKLPDIYITRFTPGYFGVAIPASRASGGAFVAIANWLDPSPTQSLGSLYGTVAHELFHLVQFSYFSPDVEPSLPTWIEEGSAGGIEGRVDPELHDVLWSIQTRDWLATPSHSITTSPYGAETLWSYVARAAPRLLPALLTELARRPEESGLVALCAACERTHATPFAQLFHDFVVASYDDERDEFDPTGRLIAPRTRVTVGPLSVQYLRLPVATGPGYELTAELPSAQARTHVSVVYRLRASAGSWPRMVRREPDTSSLRSLSWHLRPASTHQDLAILLTSTSLSRGTSYLMRLTAPQVGRSGPP